MVDSACITTSRQVIAASLTMVALWHTLTVECVVHSALVHVPGSTVVVSRNQGVGTGYISESSFIYPNIP